ncbi:hypothetical protein [Lacipirellula limnantheis]|uniref:Uncharacterized protein n=1 Tax=Lacipirellula limnantheis TaxID=2528024 RepID=A0A517U1C5_9BACT|nr:hypothetical protein [Lacipirellula limnantheis]QDT74432.1 hypothetical protein I41_36280 [Lacipirellula limnantheis]
MADKWQDAEVVELPAPIIPRGLCPNCGDEGRLIIRTMTGADRSVTRRCKCPACSTLFIELQSPPDESDLDDYAPWVANGWQN